MKSGQMFGTIFIYVVSLIVMAMIFVYGYSAVKSTLGKGEEVLFVQMKTEIKSAIEDVSSDYGRVDKKKLSIPGNYEKVYFIDLETEENTKRSSSLCTTSADYNPIICDAWLSSKAGSESPNMFLVHGATVKSLDIGNIQISNGYKKFNAPRGEITLRLEGIEGGRVLLDEWR